MAKRKKHKPSELHRIWTDAYQIDQRVFAEQRGNAQLFNSLHYGRKSEVFDRNAGNFFKKESQVIRVTENHINKIVKSIANSVKTQVPDVTVRPKNMDEFGDQKRADLHRAVLEDWKKKSCFKDNEFKFIQDWIIFGEMFTKTYWDPERGPRLPDLVITKAEIDLEEKTKDGVEGIEFEIDKDGIETKRVTRFQGDVVTEMIYPFDVIRDSCSEDFKTAEWIGVKKLVDPEILLEKFSGDSEKANAIKSAGSNEYQTFRVSGEYSKTENKVLVKEIYFRKSFRYPDGYFFIMVGGANPEILYEGKLPGGIFPIDVLGFDEIATSPRYASIIRQLRPNQLQINLMKSKMIEHTLRIGDTNIFIQKGSKLSKPTKNYGVRVREYTGQPPLISEGKVGEQFLAPIQQNIELMYQKAGLSELLQQKQQQVDAHTALYLNAKQKAVYVEYVCKYESFLKRVFDKVLRLKKLYMEEESIVLIAGSDERINVSEYKTLDDLGYEICLEGQTEDAETKLGRSLDLQKILQYGANFDQAQLGVLIKNMPYLNNEAIYETLTQDYQNLLNDICRLDRGDESVLNVRQYENHDYMIQGLIARTKKPDFEFLSPQIQQLYQQKIQLHEQTKIAALQQAAAMNADFIPTGGALLKIEGLFENDGVTKRGQPKVRAIRIPQESLNWLRDRLQAQGLSLQNLEQQQDQVKAEIAGQFQEAQLAQQAQQQLQAEQEQALLEQALLQSALGA